MTASANPLMPRISYSRRCADPSQRNRVCSGGRSPQQHAPVTEIRPKRTRSLPSWLLTTRAVASYSDFAERHVLFFFHAARYASPLRVPPVGIVHLYNRDICLLSSAVLTVSQFSIRPDIANRNVSRYAPVTYVVLVRLLRGGDD